MRLVYNISSAHVPDVMGAKLVAKGGTPYQNRHDLKQQLGANMPKGGGLREKIDEVVAEIDGRGLEPKDLYYGAVELNGAGIRYFGDFCLVLKPDDTRDEDLLILNNSYDVHRLPARYKAFFPGDQVKTRKKRMEVMAEWAGRWPSDAPDMAVTKLLWGAPPVARRLTTGTIASRVLADEDYIEVVRKGTFGAEHIEEIRVSAVDAGADARIGDRTLFGPPPPLEEMQWRQRRRGAEKATIERGIKVRVVFTLGRDRG